MMKSAVIYYIWSFICKLHKFGTSFATYLQLKKHIFLLYLMIQQQIGVTKRISLEKKVITPVEMIQVMFKNVKILIWWNVFHYQGKYVDIQKLFQSLMRFISKR